MKFQFCHSLYYKHELKKSVFAIEKNPNNPYVEYAKELFIRSGFNLKSCVDSKNNDTIIM